MKRARPSQKAMEGKRESEEGREKKRSKLTSFSEFLRLVGFESSRFDVRVEDIRSDSRFYEVRELLVIHREEWGKGGRREEEGRREEGVWFEVNLIKRASRISLDVFFFFFPSFFQRRERKARASFKQGR